MAVIPVFVSSTFRDFHAERDELVASVLPALNDLVSQYGCRVEMIDLRWGVTAADDDERQARVLEVCLKEIERARPLFVGLLGDRYGWVPDDYLLANAAGEVGMLEYTPGISVTSLEFEHGALLRPAGESVFLEREIVGRAPDGWRDDDMTRADALKARVREHCEVHTYRLTCDGERVASLNEFIDCATRVIGEKVTQRAVEIAGSQIDPVAAAESLFFEDRLRAFDGRADLVTATVDRVRAGTGVCLAGESGAGKSAIWCAAVTELSNVGARVVAVPVGAAPEVTTLRAVLMRTCAALGIDAPPTFSVDELQDYTRSALSAAAPLVFAVDGIDQLAGHSHPTFLAGLPAGVTVLVSTTVPEQAQYVAATGLSVLEVSALPPEAGRSAVHAMCKSLGRALPPAAVDRLTAEPRTPLWLRLSVGELSALDADDFASVDPTGDPLDEIARLVTATVFELPPATGALIARIIDRAGERFGGQNVSTVLSLAAVSRSGLRPNDFEELTGLNTLTVAGIRRAVSGLLIPRGEGGRLGYAHGVVRQYVTDQLVPAHTEAQLHRILARHFETYEDDPVCQEDRLWHLFRDKGASAAPILNRVAPDRQDRLASVVVDSLSVPGLPDSLRGLDDHGVGFLAQTVLGRKSAMRTDERITLSTNVFTAAREFVRQSHTDETVLHSLSNAACCLADLPSAIGIELGDAADEAFTFTTSLASQFPESQAVHEANALIAMWLAREIRAQDKPRYLAASRTAVQEWQWVLARESSLRVKAWLQFALTSCGRAELDEGNIATARSHYEQALPLTRELRDSRGDAAQNNVNVVNALFGLGTVADAEENRGEVLRYFGEAAQLAEADYAEDPSRGATQQLAQLARAYGMALGTEHAVESHRWLSQSDDRFQELLCSDPANSQWPFGMQATGLAAVAELLAERPDEATRRIRRAIANAPDADSAVSMIAQSLAEASRREVRAANHRAVIQISTEAVRLLTENGHAPTGHDHALLADALSSQAHAEEQLELWDAATASMRRSISSRRRYLGDPTAREYTTQARTCGISLVELAFMYHGDQRVETVHEVAAHWTRFLPDDVGEGGRSNQWLAQRLATLAATSLDDAPVLLPAARRYAQHLIASDPDNLDYRACVAGVCDVAGVIATKTGEYDAAAQEWLTAAQIVGSVDAASEPLTSARRSIAVNLTRVSKERRLTPELSNRCLAAAAVLMGVGIDEPPPSPVVDSKKAPAPVHINRHPQLARSASLELAVMVPLWLVTVGIELLVFL